MAAGAPGGLPSLPSVVQSKQSLTKTAVIGARESILQSAAAIGHGSWGAVATSQAHHATFTRRRMTRDGNTFWRAMLFGMCEVLCDAGVTPATQAATGSLSTAQSVYLRVCQVASAAPAELADAGHSPADIERELGPLHKLFSSLPSTAPADLPALLGSAQGTSAARGLRWVTSAVLRREASKW